MTVFIPLEFIYTLCGVVAGLAVGHLVGWSRRQDKAFEDEQIILQRVNDGWTPTGRMHGKLVLHPPATARPPRSP
jgi:hypothetical protein